ncbi:hypothetical protein BpHYR1_035627 [Brachionus plicatilis]|uniref:Uncharacterized protein n=1 Tax=Brachionus plicatilis TaxID=10195 RepID=A0A3M7RQG9_BRAPC|nr:hypothetical protein BpHYR1_035627 [Brachionus plicatilis]
MNFKLMNFAKKLDHFLRERKTSLTECSAVLLNQSLNIFPKYLTYVLNRLQYFINFSKLFIIKIKRIALERNHQNNSESFGEAFLVYPPIARTGLDDLFHLVKHTSSFG